MTKNDYVLNTYTERLMIAKSINERVYNNEFNKLLNLKHVRNKFDNRISIKDIFLNRWEIFKVENIKKLRASVISNVENMISCKDYRNGYIAYSCKKCDEYTFTAFSCNSRFCTTCGKKYRDFRSLEIQTKLIDVPHRHFVFTIAKELRHYFFKYRDMQNLLFKSVNDTLTKCSIISKKELSNNTKLGFIVFLHTYGRDLKPNPHIHALVAEAKVDDDGNVKKYQYFHFEKLRKYFMFSILNLMSKYLKKFQPHEIKDFNKLKYYLIKTHVKGFYVYGPANNEKLVSVKDIANYIARYGSHPAISESRIVSIDYEKNTIMWKFDPHEDDGLQADDTKYQGTQFITESIDDFIIKLIRHIPDKNFHLIRYFGFYANKCKTKPKTPTLLWINKIRMLKSMLKYTVLISNTFKYNPHICKCGGRMTFDYSMSYFPMKGCVF